MSIGTQITTDSNVDTNPYANVRDDSNGGETVQSINAIELLLVTVVVMLVGFIDGPYCASLQGYLLHFECT